MTQLPPVWVALFISGGALLVGSMTLLTRGIIEGKEEQVKLHKDLYSIEKERSGQERVKLVNALNEMRAILKEIEALKLDPITLVVQKSIFASKKKTQLWRTQSAGLTWLAGDAKHKQGGFDTREMG